MQVERPDLAADSLGLAVVDEPLAAQSDPSLLDLQMRAVTRSDSQTDSLTGRQADSLTDRQSESLT